MKAIFKKSLAVMTGVMLCAGTAVHAEEQVTGMFENNELTQYVSMTLDTFMNSVRVKVSADENGVVSYTDGEKSVILTLKEGEELTADAGVYEICMNDLQDIRGIAAGDSVSVLLEKYPNDNPELRGTENAALLYMEGDLNTDGIVKTGYLTREMDRITAVYYCVINRIDEESPAVVRQVCYTVAGNVIRDIDYQDITITLDEARMLIDELADSQENGTYLQTIHDAANGSAEKFGREDLYFSGIDLLTMTDEEILAELGTPEADDMIEDAEAGQMVRVCEWDEKIQVTFVYTMEHVFEKTVSVRIYGAGIVGPRGVQTGDSVQMTVERFYHEEESGSLYGAPSDDERGEMQKTDTAITVIYTCTAEGRQCVLHMTFYADQLGEILISAE